MSRELSIFLAPETWAALDRLRPRDTPLDVFAREILEYGVAEVARLRSRLEEGTYDK